MFTARKKLGLAALLLFAAFGVFVPDALAHGIAGKDADFVANAEGVHIFPYLYLGAKHMVTGYDHLLFILGVIFFLYRLSHVALYVTLFSIGHSLTLLFGVIGEIHVDAYLVDAIIGLSVAYKGFDNLNGFETLFGESPNERLAVFIFGLFHGLGLATKLQDLGLAEDGLLVNLVSFNLGVELGQLVALIVFVLVLRFMPPRTTGSKVGTGVNIGLVIAGFTLMAYQLALYLNN